MADRFCKHFLTIKWPIFCTERPVDDLVMNRICSIKRPFMKCIAPTVT